MITRVEIINCDNCKGLIENKDRNIKVRLNRIVIIDNKNHDVELFDNELHFCCEKCFYNFLKESIKRMDYQINNQIKRIKEYEEKNKTDK